MADGERLLGTVSRLIELPSCEALEVVRDRGGQPLLVPMVKDAIRRVDPSARRIEVDLDFLALGDESRGAEEDPRQEPEEDPRRQRSS